MLIIDGKKVSEFRRSQLKSKTEAWTKKSGRKPGLAVVLIGENPASEVYVANKIKGCQEVGFNSYEYRHPKSLSESDLKALIDKLNKDKNVDGILVQLPLPAPLREDEILKVIDPMKDVDGLTTASQGMLMSGHPLALPCTPAGVMALLEYYKIPVAGKNAVVVGRSNIVGKPMAQLLLAAHATVTICHSKTVDMRSYTSTADIVVVAAGKPRFMGREDFKKDAVVIDVGIHRQSQAGGKAKLCGDVRYEELDGWASAATPVPGGVGPMTITMLLENTLRLAEHH